MTNNLNIKILKTIFFIVILFYGCEKEEVIRRPPFTNEQLQWIQNVQNPKYRVVTQKNGMITSVDTVETLTKIEVVEKEDVSHYSILRTEILYSNEGYYNLAFVNFYNFFDSLRVTISNYSKNSFSVKIPSMGYISNDGRKVVALSAPDTANINGVIYSNVYKLIFLRPPTDIFKQAYFKKGIGFLYLEKDSIRDTDTLIYTATMIQK